MTLKELSQLYWLNREIEMHQQQLNELEANAGYLASPSLSGMPRSNSNSSQTENEAVEIIALRELIERKKQKCLTERLNLEKYIETIPDSLTRQIFTYRFINGLSWLQVAASIGGGNTKDSVRMLCNRYIGQLEQKNIKK